MNILANVTGFRSDLLEDVIINKKSYRVLPGLSFPDVIFGLSFGLNRAVDSVNYGLAQSIIDIRDHYGSEIPAIVQERMTPCLDDLSVGNYHAVGRDSDYNWRLDSHDILQLSIERAVELGLSIDRIIYVAHPAHVQRVMNCGVKLGLNGCPFILSKVQWSENDPERWVRSKRIWVSREIVARIVYRMKGYI